MSKSPFPQGTSLPDGAVLGRAVSASDGNFWIHATKDGRRVLLMSAVFTKTLREDADRRVEDFRFGDHTYGFIVAHGALEMMGELKRPRTAEQAMPFARALAAVEGPLSDAIFIEMLETLIPIDSNQGRGRDKAEILGRYLTGGVEVSASDIVALQRILPKIGIDQLLSVASTAGIQTKAPVEHASSNDKAELITSTEPLFKNRSDVFVLPGRKALTDFFNEHVIDIVKDEKRYAKLGIGFPGGIILEGPTGCGKTFAVERLIEYLGWSSFSVESSSVASPYIHETARKVAEVFTAAIEASPAVIVIDEMDAFLSNRDSGGQQHHVEEVAEFLRRIPEATSKRVLVIGMTNQVDVIDTAILRRGRFDHIIHVDHAGKEEVEGLLTALLASVPNDVDDIPKLAAQLAGRPLSDASFIVREAGRLAARERKEIVGSDHITAALAKCRSREDVEQHRIGF